MEDGKLVENIKNNACSDSFNELKERHSGICYDTFAKYSKVMSDVGYEKSDINTDKDIVIFKAAKSFESNKGVKFGTWLCNQMRYFCLNYINKNKKFRSLELTKEQQYPSFLGSFQVEERASKAMSKIKQMEDPRVFKVFQMRYFNSKPSEKKWKNIANSLGVSNQTALNIHKRGIDFLKKNLTEIE